MKIKIGLTLIFFSIILAATASDSPPAPPNPASVADIKPGRFELTTNNLAAITGLPRHRIAYEVTCQNLACGATSVLKPFHDGNTSSRTVPGGYMVSRLLIFKCPKCKGTIMETLPEQFWARTPLKLVVLPEPTFLKRLFSANSPTLMPAQKITSPKMTDDTPTVPPQFTAFRR